GCLENCYKLGGQIRKFIQKCVVGGRCMIANNNKCIIKKKLSNFDAVSLYPSAMSRMGFLKGKPFILKEKYLDYNNLSTLDGYFIEIDVLSINKKRIFPLISRVSNKNENNNENNEIINGFDKIGTRNFDNSQI